MAPKVLSQAARLHRSLWLQLVGKAGTLKERLDFCIWRKSKGRFEEGDIDYRIYHLELEVIGI